MKFPLVIGVAVKKPKPLSSPKELEIVGSYIRDAEDEACQLQYLHDKYATYALNKVAQINASGSIGITAAGQKLGITHQDVLRMIVS